MPDKSIVSPVIRPLATACMRSLVPVPLDTLVIVIGAAVVESVYCIAEDLRRPHESYVRLEVSTGVVTFEPSVVTWVILSTWPKVL